MMTKPPLIAFKTYITKTQFIFHCNFKVKIPEEFGETLLDECFDLLKEIDLQYNSYQKGSYFHQINQQAGKWVSINKNCFNIIQQLLVVSKCTEGAYDISCMPLLKLWGFYKSNNDNIPSESEIKKTLTKVNFRKIKFKKSSVCIDNEQELITGSFIKSFAVDKLIIFLKNKGVSDAIINAGGSTIYGINDDTHESWKINLPNTDNQKDSLNQISIRNQCFSLSSCTNNHIIIHGKKYGHILNAITGYPTDTVQVGVWCKNAFLSDVLSTAISSLEKNKVIETIERLKSNFEFDYYRIEKQLN